MSATRWRDVDLNVIGPQRPDEPVLARRVRFHQSWYRAAVLGLPSFGVTAGRAPRALGSILTDADAVAGHNFTSEASQRLYQRRRAAGWGVDPVRCTKYLTSSQTLTLNLLGTMQESPRWAARALGLLLDRPDLERITGVWVEYAPRRRSEYLNDMTRIDALVQVRTRSGDELVAIETKYADRFNSRRVDIDKRPYRELAARVGVWNDPDAVFGAPQLNQLVRCHALGVAVTEDLLGRAVVPHLLVVHHRDDLSSRILVDDYADHLADSDLVDARTLDQLVDALTHTAASPGQRRIARALELRYVAQAESEAAWLASGDRSLRGGKVSGPGSTR
ncbi:hypothetical protein ncot_10240 [Nocardioides sp. JQ2195]|uniref:PGN_0703 family putative restriction endonuclease n=1 Tax=Nocardioides sp. JQ2195 TaxID=2592334 RepID=UPI00143E5297|nr:hypothetical protein [Nocardioides sp. JQ2195]QIX26939.1 hypothetical protein ncot_10240 [Nocardioides sp. JQ2195]